MEPITSDKTYIILLNYNGPSDTIECLKSLTKLTYPNYRVIIVDNNSSDTSLKDIENWFVGQNIKFDTVSSSEKLHSNSKYVLMTSSTNAGFAAGNNIGLRYAMSQDDFTYAWILNNDTIVEPESLSALIRRTKQDSEIGLCGSLVYDDLEHSRTQFQAGGRYNPVFGTTKFIGDGLTPDNLIPQGEVEKALDYISGASILVTKNFLTKIGLLNEKYFLFFEEIDWSARNNYKFKLAYAQESVIFHKGGSTTHDSGKISPMADFYAVRSRILVTAKYFPYYLPTVYLGILVVTIPKRLLKLQFNRCWQSLRLLLTVGHSSFNKA